VNRDERLAQNEILFRNVNERIKELQSDQWGFEEVDFMCECADESCTKVVRLPSREYERIRNEPTHFLVLPGHEVADVEDVFERHDEYLVVEKHEETEQQVTAADPRQ
jgi:hypothetical protein